MTFEAGMEGLPPSVETGKKSTKASDRIRARLLAGEKRYFANDSIADFVQPGEKEELKEEVQTCIQNLLNALVIDQDKDHNTKETGKRVAKMFLDEVMMGRYDKMPDITSFPNDKKLDQLYTVGPISIRSMCSHHMVPITGHMWIGAIPGKRLIGLSKFARLAHWVMSRPQIQEEAIIQVVDTLEKAFEPSGIAVTIRAEHMCMCWRGVKDNGSTMVNTVVRGILLANPSAKQEYIDTIKGQGF